MRKVLDKALIDESTKIAKALKRIKGVEKAVVQHRSRRGLYVVIALSGYTRGDMECHVSISIDFRGYERNDLTIFVTRPDWGGSSETHAESFDSELPMNKIHKEVEVAFN